MSTIVENCTVHQCAAGSLTLNMNEVRADPVNTYREGYGFARCRAKICGDSVKGDHFRCLSRFQGGPDLEP